MMFRVSSIRLHDNATVKDHRTKTIYQTGDWKLVLVESDEFDTRERSNRNNKKRRSKDMDNNKIVSEYPEQLAMGGGGQNIAESAGKRSGENIAELVQSKIEKMQESGEIHFPANYSVSNAIRSAWLQSRKPRI